MSTFLMVDLPGGPLGSPGPDIVPEPVHNPVTDVPDGPYDPGVGRPSLPQDPPDGPVPGPADPEGDTPAPLRRQPEEDPRVQLRARGPVRHSSRRPGPLRAA